MKIILSKIQSRIKINPQTGCHEWSGGLLKDGYGAMRVGAKTYRVHRLIWESINGEIPPGLLVCHHCDNPKCCNISHLFIGTRKDNQQDMSKKGRSFAQRYPEKLARGDKHGTHTKPESVPKGEKHHNAKLNEKLVRKIRKQHLQDKIGIRKLAAINNVSYYAIWAIVNYVSWKSVK